MKKFYYNNKEIINYLIIGFLTVLVSIISFYLLRITIFKNNTQLNIQISTFISWFIAVIFAYFTNKKYVFESKSKGKENIYEMFKFFASRIFTLFVEMLFMWILTSPMSINDKLSKVLVQIVVIVLNYILSKIFVFKKV